MSDVTKALLLIGSPARAAGTSHSLGHYLLTRLAERGCSGRVAFAYHVVKELHREEFLREVMQTGLLVLSFPVYIDSIPAALQETLQSIIDRRKIMENPPTGRILAIANSDLPEARHTSLAIDVCRVFAAEAGYEWAGGLGMGAGHAIGGAKLDELGVTASRLRKALELTADALARGGTVPERAAALMAKPLITPFFYRLTSNMKLRRRAAGEGVLKKLLDQPFIESK